MEYAEVDETGKKEVYKVAYSQVLQERIDKRLKINNILLWILIGMLMLFVLALFFRGTSQLILWKLFCIGS